MIEQYPHRLTYRTAATEDIWDDVNGGWIPGTPGAEITVRCRAIPAGSGKTVLDKDGVTVDYKYDLAFPLSVEQIPDGIEVEVVKQTEEVIVKDRIIRHFIGQLHGRGWI
jgi:hypothetical protein